MGNVTSGERALHVALDVSAVPAEPVGAGRYTIELTKALSLREDLELVLIARRDDAARWTALSPRAAAAQSVLNRAPKSRPARLLFEELLVPSVLRASGAVVDLIHAPHYNAPRFSHVPLVVTVHDLTLVEHPEWHERSKAVVFSRALRLAAARAAVIICPSRRSAEAFSTRFSPKASVRVVAHGIDHERFSAVEPSVGADRLVLGRLRIEAPYVLHLGTIEPRKNLPVLVQAFDQIAESHHDLRLVLAGGLGWGNDALQEAITASRHAERVISLGYVQDGDVPALLRGASAVAYPSSEEGFGLPVLEALACGAPLVTSKETVMAELSDGAALLVRAGEAGELAGALEALVSGRDETRRQAGIEHARKFSWQACATGHVAAYRDAMRSL